jgi:dCMP deaminase
MRPTLDQTFLRMAQVLAARAACNKRQVGCIITDVDNQVVGTGYNGRARGAGNCEGCDVCTNGCEGVHAEINALLQAGNRGVRMYQTHAPCWHCLKSILNSGIGVVYYLDASTLELESATLAAKVGLHLRHAKL